VTDVAGVWVFNEARSIKVEFRPHPCFDVRVLCGQIAASSEWVGTVHCGELPGPSAFIIGCHQETRRGAWCESRHFAEARRDPSCDVDLRRASNATALTTGLPVYWILRLVALAPRVNRQFVLATLTQRPPISLVRCRGYRT